MRSGRWALYVDAGWLFAGGTIAAFGEQIQRSDVTVIPNQLTKALRKQAKRLVPEYSELLRIYWYDGAPNRLPNPDQVRLAEEGDVKLRLGRVSPHGQKGVDGLIIHDLITHAYRKSIDDAVLLSGDEDLLDAIDSAQAHGTRVHLLEIPVGGISRLLIQAADRRCELPQKFFKDHFHHRDDVPTEPETTDSEDKKQSVPKIAPGALHASQPKWRPAVLPDWMHEPIPEVTINGQSVSDIAESFDFGYDFAEKWLDNTTQTAYEQIMAQRPYLGADLDRDMLVSASKGRELSFEERRALRDGFWERLERGA